MAPQRQLNLHIWEIKITPKDKAVRKAGLTDDAESVDEVYELVANQWNRDDYAQRNRTSISDVVKMFKEEKEKPFSEQYLNELEKRNPGFIKKLEERILEKTIKAKKSGGSHVPIGTKTPVTKPKQSKPIKGENDLLNVILEELEGMGETK